MMLASIVLAITPVQARIETTYYETFSTETTNTNPSSSASEGSWYAYAEDDFHYANVNKSDVFLINDSTSPPTTGYANFTFATLPAATSSVDISRYTSFYFEFKYNNSMSAKAKSNHSAIKIMLKGATYIVCNVHVYGLNETVTNLKNRIVITNYSGTVKANHTAKYGFTYSILYTPDYDTNTLTVTLTNVSSGATMNTTTMTLMGEDTIQKFYMQNYPASRKVYIALDNFEITKSVPTYTTFNNIEQLIVIVAAPCLLFVAIAMLAITGNIATPEALVGLLVIILFAFITMAFLLS